MKFCLQENEFSSLSLRMSSSALAIVADGHGARGKSIAQELTKRTSSITDHGQNFAILAHDMLQNAHRFFCQDSSMTVGSGNGEKSLCNNFG